MYMKLPSQFTRVKWLCVQCAQKNIYDIKALKIQ
jgi:hypothetical protein